MSDSVITDKGCHQRSDSGPIKTMMTDEWVLEISDNSWLDGGKAMRPGGRKSYNALGFRPCNGWRRYTSLEVNNATLGNTLRNDHTGGGEAACKWFTHLLLPKANESGKL